MTKESRLWPEDAGFRSSMKALAQPGVKAGPGAAVCMAPHLLPLNRNGAPGGNDMKLFFGGVTRRGTRR